MLVDLLFQCLEFAIQTVILFVLLWLMIKIQKLDQRFEFSFTGVLGAAALASGLSVVLRILLGYAIGFNFAPFIYAPIVFIVLLYRVKKATGADYVDSLFTVVIARSLLFAANLFLLATLMGNLQARVHQEVREFKTVRLPHRVPMESPKAMPTNPPPVAVVHTNPPVTNAVAAPARPAPVQPKETPVVKIAAPVPVTNPPAQSPPTNSVPPTPAPPPAPVKPPENLSKYFSVKGVTRNGANSAVTIQSGAKTYTVFLDEATLMQTVDGPISVRFVELGDNTVTLEINGEASKYNIPKP